jgi:hypothetical protein
MKVNNRQQLLAVLAIAAIALLLGDRLLLTPLTSTWTDRSKRIAELKKSVSQGGLVLDRDRVIRQRWESMRTNTLPENLSAAQANVTKAFYRWSEESGISLSSVKPQWKRNSDEYMLLDCRSDGFGSLESISRFLYEMEKDPLALRVEAVEITARDNTGQQLSLALEVTGLLLAKEAPQ